MPKEPTNDQVVPSVQFRKGYRFPDHLTDFDGGIEAFNIKSQVDAELLMLLFVVIGLIPIPIVDVQRGCPRSFDL